MAAHRSVSQLETFARCGEQYRLERIEKVPSAPAAWFIQGTAFHAAVEAWERSFRQLTRTETAAVYVTEYDRLIYEETEREPDLSRWLTGGRTKPETDIANRRERGLGQVFGYLDYAAAAPERVWLIDGQPAVEVEFRINLGGVEIVGFIDQIVQWHTGEVGPRDFKTGSKRPVWPFQLVVYALAMEDLFGFRPTWGDYYIAKDGKPDPPVNLTVYDRETVTEWFATLDMAVGLELFLPAPGDFCRVCTVQPHCRAFREVG